jgi:hypothetical protein
MEEIVNAERRSVRSATASSSAKATWKAYLNSEEAARVVFLIFGFVAILLVMIVLQKQTDAICCGDWDGYYHIKWSQLLWQNFSQGKWLPSFDWLPLTVLNPHDYADHHFLFHLLQIPFLWLFEPVMAAKVAAVFFATLAIFSVYWLLYRYGIKYQLLWLAAILTCASSFYFRMNMAKAPPLTILITVVGIYLLFERKYIWLLPLMFAFVWTYSLFPLLWMASLIWVVIIAWNERRFEWRPVAYTTAGLILGNIINPYFPNNIYLFLEHFITKFKVGSDFAVAVGGEWYPYSGMELLMNFPVALTAMLIGYILFVPRGSKLPERATFFLMFVTILLAAQFRSKRFSEYFPPFAILFAAFSIQSFTTGSALELPEDVKRDLEPFLDVNKPDPKTAFQRTLELSAISVLGVLLSVFFVYNLVGFHALGIDENGLLQIIRDNEPADKYRRTMAWATGLDEKGNENIPAGEMIFNCTWDDFPKLFFYDTKHSYVYGLDPNYLYSKNPELYKLVIDITGGKVDNIGPLIREKFGARFIFADAKENDDMIAKALDSGWVEIAYEDDEARILKIRDQKGEPPDIDEAPATPDEDKQLDEIENAQSNNSSNAKDDNDN